MLPMRKPATGEPCAGDPPARFGGRGGNFPTPIMQSATKPGRNGRRPKAVRPRRYPVLRACMPRRLTRPEGRRSSVKSVLVWQKRRSGDENRTRDRRGVHGDKQH